MASIADAGGAPVAANDKPKRLIYWMLACPFESRKASGKIPGLFSTARPAYNDEGCGSSSVVERLLAKEKVAGSSPVSRSIDTRAA